MEGGAAAEPRASIEKDVMRCADLTPGRLAALLGRFGITVRRAADRAAIPGSYWGEPEAGIIGDTLWLRADTPVHSALHEGCHLICAGEARRAAIHTDAGGDFAEEDAVCYLQILLAAELPEMGSARMMADMDAWGYTFRLGSAGAWFAEDAEDARAWLAARGLLPEPALSRR